MKILLLGKDGQVGWELQRSLSPLGHVIAFGKRDLDITDFDALRARVREVRPDYIVNASAYTAVDKAEIEPELARSVNNTAVKVLADEAVQINSWLIHYSTDYVFDGKKTGPYIEADEALPLSVYGQTKLDGENAIRRSGCKHLIFRSSWVYSIRGSNFPLAILRRAIETDHINVVSDNVGAPTSASFIADVTANAIYRISIQPSSASSVSGTYHVVASGRTSWYEYAKFVVETGKRKGLPIKVASNRIFPVKHDDYKAAARRPLNSELSTLKLSRVFSLVVPSWEYQVERFIDELVIPKPI